jgi:hypothetical protein
VREIRMLRTTWRELETELRDGLRHRHEAKAAGKPLLPVPTATAPALDPTGGRRLEKCSIIRVTRWPPTLRHDQFGGGCDPFSRNLEQSKGMRGKGRRSL